MKYKFILSGENYQLSKFELETLLGQRLTCKGNSVSVDLKLPESRIAKICKRSAMIQKCYSKGKKIWDSKTDKRFSGREPNKKVKVHPVVLKPKLARLLVNLTCAKKHVLDPFCGTGSVLIEAAVLGLKPIGLDIDQKMIWFSKKNLEQFGLKANLKQADATKLETEFKENSIEAIACDPPYGRSSTLAGKEIKQVYNGFLNSAYKVLKPAGRLVFIKPHYLRLKILRNWKKLGEFEWYVHKSLIRKIIILVKE